MKVWRFIVPLVAFLVLAVFMYVGLHRNPREVPSPLIGKPAPDFALPTLSDPNRIVRLADLKGKPFVLNVWASWCVPCREEHPIVIALAQSKRIAVVGLNYKDKHDAATRWLNALGDPFVFSLVDAQGAVGLDYGVYGVPETFIVNAQGVIVYKHLGPLTPEALRDKVEPVLRSLNV